MRRSSLSLCLGLSLVSLAACAVDEVPPPQSSSTTAGDGETGETGGDAAYHFVVEVENVGTAYAMVASGSYSQPEGAGSPGPLGPGESYIIEFDARPGDHLSMASMLVESNDWFFSPGAEGLALFDADTGEPNTGTHPLSVFDAGTENDEGLAVGSYQPGGMADGAADPDSTVRLVEDPGVDISGVTVTLAAELGTDRVWHFTATLTNGTSAGAITTNGGNVDLHVSPGVFSLHGADGGLFALGDAAPELGLEALAEDGDPSALVASLTPLSGVTQMVSAGVWAVSDGAASAMYTMGAPAPGNGLEGLAEDGKFGDLWDAVQADGAVVVNGVTEQNQVDYQNGPLLPGGIYKFEFDADPGARLHFAHMFVPSNDWFIAFEGDGLALFDGAGVPLDGDVTAEVQLLDAGSEINQRVGYGLDQVHLQSGPNTGDADPDDTVRAVADPDAAPVASVLQVRVTATAN